LHERFAFEARRLVAQPAEQGNSCPWSAFHLRTKVSIDFFQDRTMSARLTRFGRTSADPTTAKASARAAYHRARQAGGLAPVLADRLWADALSACNGCDAVIEGEIMRRTQHFLALIEERAKWPRRPLH